ncbi:MAG: ABC transporter permease [Methylococcales bacterium]
MKQLSSIISISDTNLILSFIPVIVVIIILFCWTRSHGNAIYALLRMLIQLLLIGHLLMYLFESENIYLVSMVLIVMVLISSWICMRELTCKNSKVYYSVVFSIVTGGGLTLLLVVKGVLNLQPWYTPSYIIPLASMIFANAMNTVSLAAERLEAELNRDVDYIQARNVAFKAALIPITNSMFAVGLVSLPGMMTGQILSGTSPLIAARYQIIVMTMLYGSAGISAALFLLLSKQQDDL